MAADAAIDDREAVGAKIGIPAHTSRKDSSRQARLIVTGLLVLLLALLTVRLVYSLITPLPRSSETPVLSNDGRQQTDLTIFTRFDPFEGNAPAPDMAPVEVTEETSLNLKLFGTFLGETPSAIVQGASNTQGVYFIGDEIANGVKIREIRPNQILLDRRGALETLTLENRDASSPTSAPPLANALRGQGLDTTLEDLADFVRIQPDPNGQGMFLYAGRRPQMFEASGLRNGDKLLAIEGVQISASASELAGLPAKLSNGPVKLTIERGGTPLVVPIELTGLMP